MEGFDTAFLWFVGLNVLLEEAWRLPAPILTFQKILNFLVEDLPPGPKFVPFNWVINFQKCGMPLFCLSLMIYYQNFTLGSWIYFALHGSYGTFWYLKDVITPDKGF